MTGANGSLLLPEGTRLLHIGPHKTGTTSLQSAFHARRREVLAHGVRYAGPNRQPMQAAHAITGKPSPYADGRTPPRSRWTALVREVTRAGEPRVVISSEGFADADDDGIRTVVTGLDPSRLHVVVTLRPLASILPSQWQQYVQNGLTLSYEDWLRAMFDGGDHAVTPSFWLRHRHDRLIARWAAVAGADRLTAIVADERDHARVLRLFEALVGLPEGTLVPEADLANRSLTWAEAETLRALNVAFRGEGLGSQLHTKLIRFGAAEHMKRRPPDPSEPRIATPDWALERAAAVSREIVDGIAASGVRVIGDLGSLAAVPAGRTVREDPDPERTWAVAGAQAALGVILASGLARGSKARAGSAAAWPDGPLERTAPAPRPRVEPIELARISTPLLGLVVVRRLLAAGIARVRSLRRAI